MAGEIYVGGVRANYDIPWTTYDANYARGFRGTNTGTDRIQGTNVDNVLTRSAIRNATSYDGNELEETTLPIFINGTTSSYQMKAMMPNSIVRPVLRYSLISGTTEGTSSPSAKHNTSDPTFQHAFVLMQAGGGGGGGAGAWAGSQDGGSGGGSGAFMWAIFPNITGLNFYLSAGGGGDGGQDTFGTTYYGGTGNYIRMYYDGGETNNYRRLNGGSGGVNTGDTSTNIGGSGGGTSTGIYWSDPAEVFLKTGFKGGNSNTRGTASTLWNAADVYFGATLTNLSATNYTTYGYSATNRTSDLPLGTDNDGRGGTGGSSYFYAGTVGYNTVNTGSNASYGAGGGGSTSRTLAADREYGRNGGNGFVRIFY